MTTSSYPDTRLLIANEWVDATGGKTLDVRNPATGQPIGKVAHASKADLDRALAAAQKGFEAWRDVSAHERAATMRRAAALLRERAGDIARLLTQEQGKPLAEAKVEVLAGAGIIEWFADEGLRVYGRIVPSRNLAAQQLVLKEPVGPVAAFTPWNFPVNQIVRKLGAALATGCSFLVKAPEETPASPAALLQTFVDAGVPAGTVGLVFGDPAEISSYLIPHPIIRKVTFTGSTPVGKQLAALAGHTLFHTTRDYEEWIAWLATQDIRSLAQYSMSSVTFVTGRKLPRCSSTGRPNRISAGSTASPAAVNTAASVSPCATNCRLINRLSMPANAGPLNLIISTSNRTRLNPSISCEISSCGWSFK